MKFTASLLALLLFGPSALADPITDRFGSGVLGMQWGSSLDLIVGVFPQGDHIYATSPGNRAYVVRDDQEFLGVARDGHNVVYWFDANDRLESVTLSFPYERKDELLGALISLCGHAGWQAISKRSRLTIWGDDDGTWLFLRTTFDTRNGIAWLQIKRTRSDRSDRRVWP